MRTTLFKSFLYILGDSDDLCFCMPGLVRLSALLFSLTIANSLVLAEVYNCYGKWTSKPCDSASIIFSQERPKDEPSLVGGERSAPTNSKCEAPMVLVTSRPQPEGNWSIRSQSRSSNGKVNLLLSGSVKGNGKVGIEIVGTGLLGGLGRTTRLYSTTLNLPNNGGEKKFEARFSIAESWRWNMQLSNTGTFPGYCSANSESLELTK